MGDERILVADLGREWLKDAAFKAEYDALADEFASVTPASCEPEHHAETRSQENEMPRELGMTPVIQ